MTIALILLAGILTVLLGRWMFGKWFNHVGLYGISWSFSLALFHVGLIHYYPLETETWMIIASGWIAFVIGSAVVVCAKNMLNDNVDETSNAASRSSQIDPSQMLSLLWIINVIAIVDATYQIYNAARVLGGISNIIELGNLLYLTRAQEGVAGAVPYLGSFSLIGCLFAGYYTSLVGRIRLVALVPLFAAIAVSIANMSRALLIFAVLFYLTGYFSQRKNARTSSVAFRVRIKRFLTIAAVVGLLVTAMEIVRGNRGMTEGFAGATTSLRKLGVSAGSFITPSIVLYITAHHGVLNQYLKKDVENPSIGHYSFAPVWRILSKLGFDTRVNYHQPFYQIPVVANTGTYLREFHADYGVMGVVFGPFVLGLVASLAVFRFDRTQALIDLVILGHVYVVVGMSLFALILQSGSWLASLITGLFVSFLFTFVVRMMRGGGWWMIGCRAS
jgi:oligosaccharide repeat unit polymerase